MRIIAADVVGDASGPVLPVELAMRWPESRPSRGLTPRPPLELTGKRRDDARLLVAWRSDNRLTDARMADLASFLDAGDVVVVNTSTTRPAALVVDDELVVHLSTVLGDGPEAPRDRSRRRGRAPGTSPHDLSVVVELRHLCGAGTTPWLNYKPNGPIELPGNAVVEIVGPYPPAARPGQPARLWTAHLSLPRSLDEHLARFGRPIRYGCDAEDWPLDAYQTVFANDAGSAEMPSAARGFTAELVTRLVSKGVTIAPIVLHTGVASQEAGERPYPECFRVPQATAAAINVAHAAGRRVITVGTTATRAIETVASPDGLVQAGAGWTDLVITPERGVYVVDGLLTGWHDPEASHLMLVEAVAGRAILDRSYATAITGGFAGHEFGDFHLVLP